MRRDDFDLDAIGVFAENGVVVRPAGVRVAVFVENAYAAAAQLGRQSIDIRARGCVQRKVIQAHATAVVWRRLEALTNLYKNDVGLPATPARALWPALICAESEFAQ